MKRATSRQPLLKSKKPRDEAKFQVLHDDATLLWIHATDVERSNQAQLHHGKLAETFFEQFLYPKDVAFFNREVFHKRALAITGIGKGRIRDLVDDFFCKGQPDELIDKSASEDGVSIWLANNAQSVQSFKTTDKEFAKAMLKQKMGSIYMRAPVKTCEQLSLGICRDLQLPFGTHPDGRSRGEVEVFIASQLSKKTPTHTDFQENFTVQLKGKKLWRLHVGDLKNPLRAKSPHFANTPLRVVETQILASQMCGGSSAIDPPPQSSPGWVTVELGPGDVLYHPPGIWHNVETIELDASNDPTDPLCINLSANISVFTPTWAELLSNGIRHLMNASETMRRPAQVGDEEVVLQEMKALLQGSISRLLPQHVLPIGALQAVASAAQSSSSEDEESGDEFDSSEANFCFEWDQFQNGNHSMLEDNVNGFIFNPLALMLIESDLSDDPATFDEDVFGIVVHVNMGTSELESLSRFELVDIPATYLQAMRTLRSQSKHGGKSVEKLMKSLFPNNDAVQHQVLLALLTIGFFTQVSSKS